MGVVEHYIGEIIIGLSGTFLTLGIKGYNSLMARIKKIEQNQIKMQGEIDLNTALDIERNKAK